MTIGILGGVICCILFLKKYLGKIQKAPKAKAEGKPGFGDHATTCMFVGLCGAYIGSYVGTLTSSGNYVPLAVAAVSAAFMAVFEYFTNKKGIAVPVSYTHLDVYKRQWQACGTGYKSCLMEWIPC